ncbi:MAG: hypothetical protein JRC86_10220 [Deltaproteobacteria bacterium]|nr:hypothetical protein [Deltaproteobacteria bacterium]
MATYQGTADTNDRYQAQQIIISGVSDGATYDSFEIDTLVMDVTPPSSVSSTLSHILGEGAAERAAVAWTSGNSLGGSAYVGATFELLIGADYYVKKTDLTYATTASTILAERLLIGIEDSLEGVWTDTDELATVGQATHTRLTSFDAAGNSAPLVVAMESVGGGGGTSVFNVDVN